MEPFTNEHQSNIFSKLDVLHSRQINRITVINMVTWSTCAVFKIVKTIVFNVHFERKRIRLPDGNDSNVKAVAHMPVLSSSEIIVGMVSSFVIVVLAVLYTQRIIRNKRSPTTQEQIWIILLLITCACYMNPFIYIVALHDFYLRPGDMLNPLTTPDAWFLKSWYPAAFSVAWNLVLFGSSISTIFYIWATAHSYGLLERPTTRRELFNFYSPKLIPIALYQALRIIARFPAKVALAKFPFVNIVAMCVQFTALHKWYYDVVGIVTVLTLFELYFLVMIVRQVRKTWKKLAGVNYLQYRSKQIGFRFFVAHNLVYYTMMIIFEVLNPLIIPRYWQLSFWLSNAKFHMFPNSYGRGAVDLLFTVNLAITAYVNLPPDSVGIIGWFCGSNTNNVVYQTMRAEPLAVAPYEPPFNSNGEGCHVHVKSLVLETHVSLFNFAWLVYEWNTKKHGKTNTNRGRLQFKIEHHIKDERTDTNLIIVSAEDRIIVAFRGTSSAENIKTDIRMLTRVLSDGLPTLPPVTHDTNDWRLARVHKGFFDAYMAVSKEVVTAVIELVKKKKRPILLTGHSLGGALATICSLDLRMSLDLAPTEVIVSTFGSPRCGNSSFRAVYDELVPIHWRFALESDIVTKFPKMGYSHVGKHVLIDSQGNIFLDPNALEKLLWSGEVASAAFHKKPAYLLGLRAFCRKYFNGSFEPEFWDFRIDEAEVRVWEERTATELGVLGGDSMDDDESVPPPSLTSLALSGGASTLTIPPSSVKTSDSLLKELT